MAGGGVARALGESTGAEPVAGNAGWEVFRVGCPRVTDSDYGLLGPRYLSIVGTVSSLSVVIRRPTTPPPCPLAARRSAASTDPADEVIVVDRPAVPVRVRRPQRRRRRATGDVLVFVDADVEVHPDALARIRAAFAHDPQLTALHGSYDDRPRARGHGLGVPQPAAPPRAPDRRRARPRRSGPASGPCAGRASWPSAASTTPATRTRRSRTSSSATGSRRPGAGSGSIPTIQGTHLKRWTLRSMLWTDFARRGRAVGRAPAPARAGSPRRSTAAGATGSARWRARSAALAVLAGGRWPALALGGALVALNHAFYALLLRQLGVARGLAGRRAARAAPPRRRRGRPGRGRAGRAPRV